MNGKRVPQPIITLLTDFGERDGYVAAMKGAILTVAPHARIIDISHGIDRHNIRSAAYVLASSCTAFPRGSIHIAVVDPGVGTARRAIGIQTGGHWLIGPDNGILSWAADRLGKPVAHEMTNRSWMQRSVSATFHGRDVFAPAAAHLAAGGSATQLGPKCSAFLRLDRGVTHSSRRLVGTVVHIDHFGNVVTTLLEDDVERAFGRGWRQRVQCRIGRYRMRVGQTYADVPAGSLLGLIGSAGHLEIAANATSAAASIGARYGTTVTVTPV